MTVMSLKPRLSVIGDLARLTAAIFAEDCDPPVIIYWRPLFRKLVLACDVLGVEMTCILAGYDVVVVATPPPPTITPQAFGAAEEIPLELEDPFVVKFGVCY